jgi:hypothetical protein
MRLCITRVSLSRSVEYVVRPVYRENIMDYLRVTDVAFDNCDRPVLFKEVRRVGIFVEYNDPFNVKLQ